LWNKEVKVKRQRAYEASVAGIWLSFFALPCCANPSSDHDVRELLAVAGVEAQVGESIKVMAPLIAKMAKGLPEEELRELARVDVLIDVMVPIYRKHYSEEEVHELIGFYSTELGRKYVNLFPVISREAADRWEKQMQMAVINYHVRKGNFTVDTPVK
jgi:hypothetical protein